MFSSLLKRMNPKHCLCIDFGNDENDPEIMETELDTGILMQVVPALLDIIQKENSISSIDWLDKKINSLKTLHELSKNECNRLEMICSNEFELLEALTNCIDCSYDMQSNRERNLRLDEIRRQSILLLNNLSIPKENKIAMIRNHHFHKLLANVSNVIRLQIPEATYLCCILLMNITLLPEAVEPVIMFTTKNFEQDHTKLNARQPALLNTSIDAKDWETFPTSRHVTTTRQPTPPRQRGFYGNEIPCLENPLSLLRSIEKLMRDQQPFLMSKAFSVEGEGIRWCVGLLRNLTLKNKYCMIIAQTEIPLFLLGVLRKTRHSVMKWTQDTIEDMSLTVIDQLASSPAARDKLKSCGARNVINAIDRRECATIKVQNRISSILEYLDE